MQLELDNNNSVVYRNFGVNTGWGDACDTFGMDMIFNDWTEEAGRLPSNLQYNGNVTFRTAANELEIAFGHANSANADAQKTIKKYMETVRELTNDRSQASAVAPELPGGMIL
ncbi:hypothetical protein Q1695_004167 [Nippostrongylus brasiliensis]|nr:hypothetical protein Q1695_004167 [Nippostrongylus brasiliensis]